MEPIDSNSREKSREANRDKSDAIGWHLIARGGDMTARVHRDMQLGILPSGDLSFEAPDAVVVLNPVGTALTLDVVGDDYELELEAGERLPSLRVGAQTHIRLDFLGHTLDIDNDFAVASPPGDALAVYVVGKGEVRQPLGPLSASAHDPEIRIQESASVTPLKAVPVDYLQREHAVAAADKRHAAPQRSGVKRAVLALAASVLVVAGLVVTALYVASRSVEESVSGGETVAGAAATATNADPGVADSEPVAAAAESSEPAPIDAGPGVSEDMLARLSALLEADPLPDKATIDFAVESLRSLMVAYPNDGRIPAALATLNERLVQEARQSYDDGDAFRAGRLIEQATTLGMADASVAETLDYFSSEPPGSAVVESVVENDPAVPVSEPTVSDAEAEAMLSEAIAQEEAAAIDEVASSEEVATLSETSANADSVPAAEAAASDTGLDSLVESATGLALGALAVELVIEDVEPASSAQSQTDPVLAALGPALPLTAEPTAVEARVQLALDSYLADSLTTDSGISANELPADFEVDAAGQSGGVVGTEAAPEQSLSATDSAPPPPAGPRYVPYSRLLPLRQSPLVYPERADQGAEGSISVEFTVTETGRVIDVNVSGEAPPVFLREAARTIRNWRFAPVRENGERVSVRSALRITYRS